MRMVLARSLAEVTIISDLRNSFSKLQGMYSVQVSFSKIEATSALKTLHPMYIKKTKDAYSALYAMMHNLQSPICIIILKASQISVQNYPKKVRL